MPDWALALIALSCGIAGLALGYLLGYRNGCVCGELRALHVAITQMRSRPEGKPHLAPARSPLLRD